MNFYSCLPDAVLSRNEITLPTATMNSLLPWDKKKLALVIGTLSAVLSGSGGE